MKPNEEVEIVLNAEIFNVCVDLSMNDAYEHVVKNCFLQQALEVVFVLEICFVQLYFKFGQQSLSAAI